MGGGLTREAWALVTIVLLAACGDVASSPTAGSERSEPPDAETHPPAGASDAGGIDASAVDASAVDADASGLDASVNAPVCGKLSVQSIDPSSSGALASMLQACPRVAKWMYPDFAAMQAYKSACPGAKTVLRIWGPPGSWATADAFWNARYAGLANATAAQKAAVDWLESDNECDAGHCLATLAEAIDYGEFLEGFVVRAKKEGFRPLVGNIAVGNPPGDIEKCTDEGMLRFGALVPAIVKAANAGGGWAYHAYTQSWSKDAALAEYLALRHRRYVKCFPELASVPLVLSEAGFDLGGNPDADGFATNGGAVPFLDWLEWFQKEIAKDKYVVGATLFALTAQGTWPSFRLDTLVPQLKVLSKKCPP